MPTTFEGRGSTIDEALAVAIARLVTCDPQKVEVRVEAPGLEAVAGPVRFDLEIDELAETEQRPSRSSAEPRRSAAADAPPSLEHATPEELEEEADAAADFLEGLLDAMDLPGDLRIRVDDDHVQLEVVDIGSGALIGRRGQTLEAIQELVRSALQRQFERRARVMIDAEGYRARRLEKLLEKAEEAIDAVLDTGEPERLEPMDVFERKTVHQLVAEVDGLTSRSTGREPARRVIIELDDE